MLTFDAVMYDPDRDQNALGREVLRRLGVEPDPNPYYTDSRPLACPGCGGRIEDDDEETWWLPEGVFWHDECYISEAMPLVGAIFEEEYERRIAMGE